MNKREEELVRERAGTGVAESVPLTELALEREKIQIERERLALERERWSAERDKYKSTQQLADRAAGRMTIGISTFSLALLCAFLIGGGIGAWMIARQTGGGEQMAASLAHALSADGTNVTDKTDFSSPILHPLGRSRRPGGYLLILN